MNQRRLLWYLFPSYLIITIIALITVTIYAYYLLSKNYIEVISNDLKENAQIVENQVREHLIASEYAVLDSIFNLQVHGGKVNVESEIGKGSNFSLYIPFNQKNNKNND